MFTASWCGPCKRVKSEIYGKFENNKYVTAGNGLASIYGKSVTFYLIDVEKNPDLLTDKNFSSVQTAPTFFFAKLVNEGATKSLQINKNIVKGGDKNNLVDMIKKCM